MHNVRINMTSIWKRIRIHMKKKTTPGREHIYKKKRVFIFQLYIIECICTMHKHDFNLKKKEKRMGSHGEWEIASQP